MLDLLDIVVTKVFSDAAAVGKRARLRTIRDLDAAALKLRRAGAVLMDDTMDGCGGADDGVRSVPRAEHSRHALEQIDLLIRPAGRLYFTELRAQNSKLRFMPALLRSVAIWCGPSGTARAGCGACTSGPTRSAGHQAAAPLAFVPSGWKRQVGAGWRRSTRSPTGFACWRACGPRSGGGTSSPPPAYATRTRASDCCPARRGRRRARHLPHARPLDRCSGRNRPPSERLDIAYRTTASKSTGQLADVTVDGTELVLSPLDKLDEPRA